jgi:multidrug efflux pump subunit AcrA (membrane-fusion protein)
MSKLTERPWLNLALGVLCIAAIVVAYTTVGPASQSSAQTTRTATVQKGVVQSTVSGSGNIQAASQLNLGFKTSGTVTHIYVAEGQRVTKGQLLAMLNPQSAEVTLEQAKANLQSAEANLAKVQETGGETSSGQSSTGTSTATTAATASAAPSNGGTASSSSSPESAATREANLASAKAAVKSDQLTVRSDEQAVQDTKLYAPEGGTIVALSGEVGETVSATGTTKASTSSSSTSTGSSGSSSSGTGTGTTGTGATGTGSSSSTSGSVSSSSSSASFAVLSNLSSMRLVVPLSESEVGSVKAGQTATVTIEALSGRKVAAHVLGVADLSTSNSGVVSYDVTFQLDQPESGLKAGMSATGEVVVKQAEGLNIPSTAISGGSVTVVRNGKHVSQAVTTGLAGDSSTIILSGLKAGEQVVLPSAASTTTASASKATTPRVGGLGGGGLGGALGGGGGSFPGGARAGGG